MAGVVIDTSGLLAWFDSSEPEHDAVAAVLRSESGPLVVSPFVIAELDYLVATRHGTKAELAVLRELASGAWELPGIDAEDLDRLTDLVDRYRDQAIGVADAFNVLLAGRYGTDRIVTLDRRHLGVLRNAGGDPLRVLPA